MEASQILRLYAYNEWANLRTLDALQSLSADQFTRSLGGSFSSIRDTFSHVVDAEWIWCRRWQGESPRTFPKPDSYRDVAALRARWVEVRKAQAAFLADLADPDLRRPVTYVNLKGETWTYVLEDALVHLVNHSSYHRGQVATLLRQVGAVPLATDYLLFLDGKR